MTGLPWRAVFGTWGAPPDAVAWVALATSLVLALGAALRSPIHAGDARRLLTSRRVLALVALGAALLSIGYVKVYLRGGPRIIDATAYLLEARVFAHGHFTWRVPEPLASFRGRFLHAPADDPGRLAVIFPPGYPVLLALGVLAHAPLAVGPVLAALLVVLSAALARELADGDVDRAALAAVSAALFSLTSAALRYHTADTMSHGASAAAIALGTYALLRATRTADGRLFALAGFAAGFVACTRFASALPLGLAVGAFALRRGPRALALALVGALPPMLLLAAYDASVLGRPFASIQRAYYAVADGPEGCFAFGFGRDVGCRVEHGDYVRATLPEGFGPGAAARITLHRLRLHLQDVANFEPLVLLVLVPLRRRARATNLALALVVGQVLAYVPFYFDGSYPGGGARFFADVLPLEHALLGLALVDLRARVSVVRRLALACACTLLGFACHASFDHDQLAGRDGGAPMFMPARLRDAGVTHGLLFIDSDHGWNLAHDPSPSLLPASLVVARARGDDHDRLLFEHLGRPPAFRYSFLDGPLDPRTDGRVASVHPYVPASDAPPYVFESENDWPPLAQEGAWAAVEWVKLGTLDPSCASAGRVLALHAQASRAGDTAPARRMVLPLPVPVAGAWAIAPRLFAERRLHAGTLRVLARHRGDVLASWDWSSTSVLAAACIELTPHRVRVDGEALDLELRLEGDAMTDGRDGPLWPALDRTIVGRADLLDGSR